MAKLNVTIPAVDVLVGGVSYRKVDRKAQAGDIVKALDRYTDIAIGAFYAVYDDGDGVPTFLDDDGDERCVFLNHRDRYETFAPIPQTAVPAPPSDTVTYEGAQYRKVDRSAREGDVIVFTDDVELPSFITLAKPYFVTEIDSADDAQIMDDDGDEFDTSGYVFDVYEKVAEVGAAAPTEYREVKRWAEKGERIRIVDIDEDEDEYEQGAEFTVNDVDGDGDVRVTAGGCNYKIVLLSEYVVLEPVASAQPAKYSVGDYVKVTGNSVCHNYTEGSVVKIKETQGSVQFGGQQFHAEKADGTRGNWLVTNDVEPADEAEFNAQKKPAEPALKVGDYAVILTKDGGILSGFDVGELVQIVENPHEPGDRHFRVQKLNGLTGYADKKHGLTPATPEEVSAAQRKAAIGPFADGGFAQIVNANMDNATLTPRSTPNANVKVTVELATTHRALRVTYPDGNYGFCNADALRQITESEYNAATATKPALNVGDTVKLTIAAGKSPHHGWGEAKNGDVGKVSAVFSDKVRVDFPKHGGWNGKPGELTKISAEEAVAIEKEAQEIAKWSAIDRKVGEFKRGDIVSIVKKSGEKGVGTVEDAFGPGSSIGVRMGAAVWDGSTFHGVFFDEGDAASLIVPVENRFDTQTAAKSAA